MRIYADVDVQTVSTIEQLASERGIRKKEFINKAIDQFIHPDDHNGSNCDQLKSDFDQLKIQYDQAQFGMRHFNDTRKSRDGEMEFLRATVHQLSEKLPKALPEFTEAEKKTRRHWWWPFGGSTTTQ
jgi:hypothetical protein